MHEPVLVRKPSDEPETPMGARVITIAAVAERNQLSGESLIIFLPLW